MILWHDVIIQKITEQIQILQVYTKVSFSIWVCCIRLACFWLLSPTTSSIL